MIVGSLVRFRNENWVLTAIDIPAPPSGLPTHYTIAARK
jgi:hypothetical protein